MLPYVLGLAAGVSTYAGGLLALRFLRRLDLLLGLSAGLVIGLALLDLLPQALQEAAGLHSIATIMGALTAGLGLYLLLHRLPSGGSVGRASLILHSLMDGIGIGLAFQLSASTGWLVAAAVLAHDLADGTNMVALSAVGGAPRGAQRWLAANAIAPVVGVAIGQTVRVDPAHFSLILAIFAGGFLYIGASELLPRSRDAAPGIRSGVASTVGIGLMAFVIHLAG